MNVKEINKSAIQLIKILESNGDKYENKFPIKISKNGNYYFVYDYEKNKWLDDNPVSYTHLSRMFLINLWT